MMKGMDGKALGCGVLATLLFDSGALPAQELRDPDYVERLAAGFEHLYSIDYADALETFRSMEKDYPEHPGPPLYLATALWLQELFEREELELDKFIAPSYFTKPSEREMPDEDREQFFDHVDKAATLSEAILEKHPEHEDARYFLGSAEGLRGAFAITIDRDKGAAFRHGKKAYQLHHELIQDAPEYYDAYATVGLYEYIVDNLPWYIKWLAIIIGYRGSEERGFEYLTLAAEKGLYATTNARVFLMLLYVREEQYDYALQVARNLHRRYSRNFLFHINVAQILDLAGKEDAAVDTYLDIVHLATEEKPNYQELPLGIFRHNLGAKLMAMGRLELALEQFVDATRHLETPARERSLSHLKAGQVLDLLGKRRDAKEHYTRVLELADAEGAHRRAKRYLKEPYEG